MEKKYYDIIVSLIKQNDKYSGCEPILDEIVQDVYDHSKVVLGSVTNEDVISAYLNKVVATSLITVPKKLNFNTRNKHRVISNVEAITKTTLQPKPVIEEAETQEIVFETLNTPIETVSELEFEPVQQEEPIIEQEESFDIKPEEQVVEEVETFSFESDELVIEESQLEEEEEEEEEFISTPSLEVAVETEATAIDSEEQPEESFIEIEEVSFAPEIEFEAQEEPVLIEKTVDETEEPSFEPMMEIETQEETIDEPDQEFVLQPEEPAFEPMMEFEIQEEPVLMEEPSEEPEVNITFVDNMINGVSNTEEEELELLEEEETLQEESSDDIPSLIEEEPISLDMSEDADLVEADESSLFVEENSDEPVASYSVPSFECFSFEPDRPEFDADSICAELQELASKHPEKKLLQVCKLKYEDLLSVSEIAEKLDFSEETVLDILNDIIELVKD